MAQHEEARVDVDLEAWSAAGLSPAEAAEIAAEIPQGILLAPAPYSVTETRTPNEEWQLPAAWPYKGAMAHGTAAVHYAPGHTSLQRPFIFADGFNYGPSDLAGLWSHLNTPYGPDNKQFLSELLAAGFDVILLGFDERHTYVQANAGIAVSCIRRAIAERTGDSPLTVGGVSMGGLVTRYALARMESDREDHQTETYLSYDSPHNGAWIPLILQQLAYFFEPLTPGKGPKQAALIRSPAAQQLLWAWVKDARTSGPVATASPLRAEFLSDLNKVGSFPMRPRKLGVANGNGQGMGRDVPPDELVFEWNALAGLLQAVVRTQPSFGDRQFIGRMRALGEWRRSYTTAVAPFDGAPGGTLASYGMLADKLGAKIEEAYRSGCFVPAVSAVALDYDPVRWPIDLHTDISVLPGEQSRLDAFQCDTENSEHGTVRAQLADWILDQLR
ncbi:hypothetical protein [Streptomyces sp. H27-D2]|uniref:hypothetical protein n=1 Tax=Streptomyces sp. H27-D2 TaxID=3046304 RepID=UPI002DBD76C5|nr:hypothetical protein [Streptomyces sp. H27-D2]MEC4020321.1 hypothetical protein [Streptomyces sp. H27-D2]